jgi:hypothetical protein
LDASQFSRHGYLAAAIHPVPSVIASQLSARGTVIALEIGTMSSGVGLVDRSKSFEPQMNANERI